MLSLFSTMDSAWAALDAETQKVIESAINDPKSVDLEKLSNVVVDQSLKDLSFCKDAGRICSAVVQAEAEKTSTNVFRRYLLNRLQKEFTAREDTRSHSVQEWVCVVTFICSTFDYIKVDCLVLQLHRVGEQLEQANSQRMNQLFYLLRDGFLLQEGLSSMTRLLLLEVLEFRAGGWTLSETAHKYYYSEVVD
ncbi:hypothetical protein DNTS_034980 [Danionella cerebrum]|uniref:MIF4G domain-containing protein n=1 Tax=Danionella cerebrum TaxID=2873325 RepID=A0A553MT86_9TELE|nr:hypothetical protein DNTS_034980 [Danionella translucida]TRY56392.1 hypothetical protein DNTS_034980 [Danionella translucida]